MNKITYDEIKNRFARLGLKVLDVENYKNLKTKLNAVDKDGYKVYLPTSGMDKKRYYDRFHKSNPHTVENIKLWLKLNDPDYELVSTEYINSAEKLEWKMLSRPDLSTFFTSWHMFYSDGNRHPSIAVERNVKSRMKTLTKLPHKVREGMDEKLSEFKGEWRLDKGEEFKYETDSRPLLNFTSGNGFIAKSSLLLLQYAQNIQIFDLRRKDESTHNMYKWSELYGKKYKLSENQEYKGSTKYYLFLCEEHGEIEGRLDSFTKGKKICRQCIRDSWIGENNPNWGVRRTDFYKPSAEKVERLFNDKGLIIKDFSNYKDRYSKFTAIDNRGYKTFISYDNLAAPTRGDNYLFFHKKNPHTLENIHTWLSLNDPDYKLLTTEYKGNKVKMEWQMLSRPDLDTFFMNWHHFQSGSRHPELAQKRASDGKRRKPKEVRMLIKKELSKFGNSWSLDKGEEFNYVRAKDSYLKFTHKEGYISSSTLWNMIHYKSLHIFHANRPKDSTYNMKIWLDLHSEYKLAYPQQYSHSAGKYYFICKKHGVFIGALSTIQRGQEPCYKCMIENNSGENSAVWNPNLTDEDRERNRLIFGRFTFEYMEWRKSVFERDGYMCVICEDTTIELLEAHHKDGYHWCAERRVDISNGETLCNSCHKEFHKTYGYGNNTEEQFNEYLHSKLFLNTVTSTE